VPVHVEVLHVGIELCQLLGDGDAVRLGLDQDCRGNTVGVDSDVNVKNVFSSLLTLRQLIRKRKRKRKRK